MTVIEKIKATGGFIDFGACGSMPWGIFGNGTLASSIEYHEAMSLRTQNRKLHAIKLVSAKKYKHSRWLVTDHVKLFGVTIYKKYHKGVFYKINA